MPYLIFALCALIGLFLIVRWLLVADPAKAARMIRLGLSGAVALVGLFYAVTGRFFLGLPLLFMAFLLYRRLGGGFALPSGGFGARGPSSGQSSEVETEYLHMELQHDSGAMRGRVRRGPYTGKALSALGLEELLDLLEECHAMDPPSAQLLETWLERAVGPDWRSQAQRMRPGGGWRGDGAEEADGGSGWGRHNRPGGQAEGMTRDEAWSVLGLEPGASNEEIKEAHRRLMMKHHPDRGGSATFAARINRAKELLLRE